MEDLAVDIDALDVGDYVLEISVKDHASGATARTARAFVKATAARTLAGER